MTKDEAIARLYTITSGIDKDEVESDIGWWETSGGALKGSHILKRLELLINDIYAGQEASK